MINAVERRTAGGFAPLVPPVTVCVLCYGDFPDLARRVLGSLLRFTPTGAIRLRFGLNAVSERTEAAIADLLPLLNPELLIQSSTNSYKVPMMRRLFHDRPLSTPWTIWFDDDSYVFRSDWLATLCYHSRLQPNVDMWGKRLFLRGDQRHLKFISDAPWFRDRELTVDDHPGRYRFHFLAGGFWAIRTACLHELNWPDTRLLHFGDDYLLGEALRQHGHTLGQSFSGVAIDQENRRAPANSPRCHVLH